MEHTKNKKEVHNTRQEKICILPMATDKEDEENTILSCEVQGDAQQVKEFEVTDSQDVMEITKKNNNNNNLFENIGSSKKNPNYANLALVKDTGTELRERRKIRMQC